MFEIRLEICNPGGIYGRIKIKQLREVQSDTRNPVLAAALEVLGVTENLYSGIPTMRHEMQAYRLGEPEFLDERGSFVVRFYRDILDKKQSAIEQTEEVRNLVLFCKTPRTRKKICNYLGLSSVTYAIQAHVMLLVEQGMIKLSITDKPKSSKQLYYSE